MRAGPAGVPARVVSPVPPRRRGNAKLAVGPFAQRSRCALASRRGPGGTEAGGYAFAFITGTMGSHARATQVENALRGCLGVPPLPD